MIAIIAIYAMASPASYLAGDVYRDAHARDADWLPWACAALVPLGALVAIMALTLANNKDIPDE